MNLNVCMEWAGLCSAKQAQAAGSRVNRLAMQALIITGCFGASSVCRGLAAACNACCCTEGSHVMMPAHKRLLLLLRAQQGGDWLDMGQPKPPKKRESARASHSPSPAPVEAASDPVQVCCPCMPCKLR